MSVFVEDGKVPKGNRIENENEPAFNWGCLHYDAPTTEERVEEAEPTVDESRFMEHFGEEILDGMNEIYQTYLEMMKGKTGRIKTLVELTDEELLEITLANLGMQKPEVRVAVCSSTPYTLQEVQEACVEEPEHQVFAEYEVSPEYLKFAEYNGMTTDMSGVEVVRDGKDGVARLPFAPSQAEEIFKDEESVLTHDHMQFFSVGDDEHYVSKWPSHLIAPSNYEEFLERDYNWVDRYCLPLPLEDKKGVDYSLLTNFKPDKEVRNTGSNTKKGGRGGNTNSRSKYMVLKFEHVTPCGNKVREIKDFRTLVSNNNPSWYQPTLVKHFPKHKNFTKNLKPGRLPEGLEPGMIIRGTRLREALGDHLFARRQQLGIKFPLKCNNQKGFCQTLAYLFIRVKPMCKLYKAEGEDRFRIGPKMWV